MIIHMRRSLTNRPIFQRYRVATGPAAGNRHGVYDIPVGHVL